MGSGSSRTSSASPSWCSRSRAVPESRCTSRRGSGCPRRAGTAHAGRSRLRSPLRLGAGRGARRGRRSGSCSLTQRIGLGLSDALVWPVVLAAMGAALIVGRSGKPIDEVIDELVGRGRRGRTARRPSCRHRPDRHHRVGLGGALVIAGVGAFLFSHNAFHAIGQGLDRGRRPARWPRADLRAVAVAPVDRARRGAQRAHPLRRARRDGGAPARLGAAEPHDDPAPSRRSACGRRAGAPSGARAAVVAVRPDAASMPTSTWPTRSRTRPPTSSSGSASRSTSSASAATCPLDERLRALVPSAREAMANAARHSGAPERRGVRGGRARAGRACSSATAAAASIPAAVPRRPAAASRSRSSGRMQRNGGTAVVRSAPRRRAPRSSCTMPRARAVSADAARSASSSSTTTTCSARGVRGRAGRHRRGRGRGVGGRCRRRDDRRARSRRRAGRRAHARRRRRGA